MVGYHQSQDEFGGLAGVDAVVTHLLQHVLDHIGVTTCA